MPKQIPNPSTSPHLHRCCCNLSLHFLSSGLLQSSPSCLPVYSCSPTIHYPVMSPGCSFSMYIFSWHPSIWIPTPTVFYYTENEIQAPCHDKPPDEPVPAWLFNTNLYCLAHYAPETLAHSCLFLTHGRLAADLSITGSLSSISLQLKNHIVREAFYSI